MFVLYLDDSGSVKNPLEDYFVLGGVAVPENSIRWLSHQLDKLAEELSSDAPSAIEFHAADIFGGRDGIWQTYRNRNDRIEILKRVLFILDNAYSEIVTFACAVHKGSFPDQDPVVLAFEEVSSRFDLYLQRLNGTAAAKHKGLIVLDKASYETNLQNLAASFRRDGNRWGSYLRNICEVPFFVDSKSSRLIQLADHIAYAVFRRYNAGDINYFNCIERRFDRDGVTGTIHGLVHKQTNNRYCTCPACLSRRP